MSAELTSLILLGLGCAANPWGIMIAVLLLDASRGHAIVWTYVGAWVGAISVVLAALLAGIGAIFEKGSESAATAASAAEILLGLSLLGWGTTRVVQARRSKVAALSDAPPKPDTPRWLQAIENISYPAAFLLGIYSATYPFVIAAAGEILRSDAGRAETVELAVLFVVLGSSSVVAVAALGTLAPGRSAVFLQRLRVWLTVHNRAVITAILIAAGLALTARGLAGRG